MSVQHIEHGDIEALAAILADERRDRSRMRGICFGLFLFFLVMLVVASAVFAWMFVSNASAPGDASLDSWLPTLQFLPAMSAAVIGFFGMWWAAQNCINSIDRTLFAARAGRLKLCASFLGNMQCADKKKRRMWMDVAASLVG